MVALFKRGDIDGDGRIDCDEFIALGHRRPPRYSRRIATVPSRVWATDPGRPCSTCLTARTVTLDRAGSAAFGRRSTLAHAGTAMPSLHEPPSDAASSQPPAVTCSPSPPPCGRAPTSHAHNAGGTVNVFSSSAAAFSSKKVKADSARKRQPSRVLVRKRPCPGPLLATDISSLGFETRVNVAVDKHVIVVNTGSTALYYVWSRDRTHSGVHTTSVADAASHFCVPNAEGRILPGASLPVSFCFAPTKLGIFTERWVLSVTPPLTEPAKSVVMRGVCTDAPETQLQTRDLVALFINRQAWQTVRDILLRDVLISVFDIVILPEADGDDKGWPHKAVSGAPLNAASGVASGPTGQGAAWMRFETGYAKPQYLTNPISRSTFGALSDQWPAVAGGGNQWDGNLILLEAGLVSATKNRGISRTDALATFEATLQGAAVATPDVSHGLRLKEAAATCCASVLLELVSVVDEARRFRGKPPSPLDEADSDVALTIDGVPVTWCWETQRYQRSDKVEAIAAVARKLRKLQEERAAGIAAWDVKLRSMSKRDRRKAEGKQRKEAEADEFAAAEVDADPEAVLPDPVALRDTANRAQLLSAVRDALVLSLGKFAEQASTLEGE